MNITNYAQTCIDALNIREESYNHEAATLETESRRREARRRNLPDLMYLVDYAEFYEKDMMQSIKEAARKNNLPEEMAYPIYLAFHWSNDFNRLG